MENEVISETQEVVLESQDVWKLEQKMKYTKRKVVMTGPRLHTRAFYAFLN